MWKNKVGIYNVHIIVKRRIFLVGDQQQCRVIIILKGDSLELVVILLESFETVSILYNYLKF